MEDHEILLKFQDPASRNVAFDQLVRKYQRKVYWHVRKMVVNHADADDLTQDVSVKVWKWGPSGRTRPCSTGFTASPPTNA